MLGLSIWKIAIIGGIVVLLFGRGKVSELMGDVAKGIKSFKKGMSDDDASDEAKPVDARTVEHRADETVPTAKEKISKS